MKAFGPVAVSVTLLAFADAVACTSHVDVGFSHGDAGSSIGGINTDGGEAGPSDEGGGPHGAVFHAFISVAAAPLNARSERRR